MRGTGTDAFSADDIADFVTDIDSQIASVVAELLKRDECFRLQASVNGYPASLVIDINDNTCLLYTSPSPRDS